MSEKNSTVQIRATGETVCYVNSRGEPMTEGTSAITSA